MCSIHLILMYTYFCHFSHLMIKLLHKYLIAVYYYFGNEMKYVITFKTIYYKINKLLFSKINLLLINIKYDQHNINFFEKSFKSKQLINTYIRTK